MHQAGNFSELPTAHAAPGFFCRGFLPSLAYAKQWPLMNSVKDPLVSPWHWCSRGNPTRMGLLQQGAVPFPMLSSSSVMPFCCIQHPVPRSWKLIILTIPHPHKCRCIIHIDTQVCMYFPVEEIWYLCFIRWTRRIENQEFWAVTQTTQLWKQWCVEKKYTTKLPLCFLPRKVSKFSKLFTTDVYPQETKIWAGWAWTGIQHQKPLLPEPGNNTVSVCTQGQTWCCRTFSPKLLYLLLISSESLNTSAGYYSSRPVLFIFLFSELISRFLTPAHCSLWNTVQKYSSTQKYSNFFLWKRLSLALALIKLYYMWCRNRWIKKYSN